jgi:hypothetical protein
VRFVLAHPFTSPEENHTIVLVLAASLKEFTKQVAPAGKLTIPPPFETTDKIAA